MGAALTVTTNGKNIGAARDHGRSGISSPALADWYFVRSRLGLSWTRHYRDSPL
jgi:hypothetical protein